MNRAIALIPIAAIGIAVSMPGTAIAADELESWSDEQLCRARDIPEALDELERREVFDRRELRAIRRDEVRVGISEDALRCMMGSPQTILRAFTAVEDGPVDAFVYPPGTIDSLIVYLMREGDESRVVAFTESMRPYVMAAVGEGEDFCFGGAGYSLRPRGDTCFPRSSAYHRHLVGVDILTDSPSIHPPPPETLPSQ